MQLLVLLPIMPTILMDDENSRQVTSSQLKTDKQTNKQKKQKQTNKQTKNKNNTHTHTHTHTHPHDTK